MILLFHPRNDKGYWKDFIVVILCIYHKEGPLVLTIQPCSIDLNHVLAILKPIDTRSKTPKKMMEFHETLYCLISLWWH